MTVWHQIANTYTLFHQHHKLISNHWTTVKANCFGPPRRMVDRPSQNISNATSHSCHKMLHGLGEYQKLYVTHTYTCRTYVLCNVHGHICCKSGVSVHASYAATQCSSSCVAPEVLGIFMKLIFKTLTTIYIWRNISLNFSNQEVPRTSYI